MAKDNTMWIEVHCMNCQRPMNRRLCYKDCKLNWAKLSDEEKEKYLPLHFKEVKHGK